jgi:23S rRNA pseudouridine2605 synthase
MLVVVNGLVPRTTDTRKRRIGVARVLSKAGICSRSEAASWVAAGRVCVNRRRVDDPEHPVDPLRDEVRVDGKPLAAAQRKYIVLNKPRGLVTTARDEQGRDTVYRCFDGAGLPWIAPVGRLDRASEGMLLFSNDPEWAAAITDPDTGLEKTYHVQVDCLPDASLIERLKSGVEDAGELLTTRNVTLLRSGSRNAWLEIVLDEGRNRQIRRLLAAHQIGVMRLLRIAIGSLQLGVLPKGAWRELLPGEIAALRSAG